MHVLDSNQDLVGGIYQVKKGNRYTYTHMYNDPAAQATVRTHMCKTKTLTFENNILFEEFLGVYQGTVEIYYFFFFCKAFRCFGAKLEVRDSNGQVKFFFWWEREAERGVG